MIDPEIRPSTNEDIDGINSLLAQTFGASTDKDELLWLLRTPESPDQLNSKVISIDGVIQGHVGFVQSSYQVNNQALIGVHATNLTVGKLPVKGMGRRMFEVVSYETDIAILYEGTPSAINMYPKSGYKIIGYSELFSTSVTFPKFASLKSPTIKAFLKKLLIPLRDKLKRLGKSFKTSEDLSFNPIKSDDPISHSPLDSALTNTPDRHKINWLNDCPFLKSLAFTVDLKGTSIGVLYLYINEDSPLRTARIVYIPNVGNNSDYWETILAFAEREFKKEDVVHYSIYASHPILREILKSKGFTKEHDRNIWCYDPKNIVGSSELHLMHLEGDHAFRAV